MTSLMTTAAVTQLILALVPCLFMPVETGDAGDDETPPAEASRRPNHGGEPHGSASTITHDALPASAIASP